MTTEIILDKSNRFVLTQEVMRIMGVGSGKLRMHVSPGRIVLEVAPASKGEVVKRGKLKVWSGAVPNTPIEDAVEQSRHYKR
jgi:hypothetical protein